MKIFPNIDRYFAYFLAILIPSPSLQCKCNRNPSSGNNCPVNIQDHDVTQEMLDSIYNNKLRVSALYNILK